MSNSKAPHTYELVAGDLADWVDRTAQKLADSLRENGRAPYAARTTEAEKLTYYEHHLFHADGSRNPHGSQKLLERFGTHTGGIAQYAQVLAAVTKAREARARGETSSTTDDEIGRASPDQKEAS